MSPNKDLADFDTDLSSAVTAAVPEAPATEDAALLHGCGGGCPEGLTPPFDIPRAAANMSPWPSF